MVAAGAGTVWRGGRQRRVVCVLVKEGQFKGEREGSCDGVTRTKSDRRWRDLLLSGGGTGQNAAPASLILAPSLSFGPSSSAPLPQTLPSVLWKLPFFYFLFPPLLLANPAGSGLRFPNLDIWV